MLMLGLLWLLPAFLLSSHFVPWTAFQQEICAGFSLVCLGTCAALQKAPWRWPVAAVVVGFAALLPVIQAAGGLLLFSGDGVLAALYLLGFALSIAIGSRLTLSRSDDLIDGLGSVFVVASLASVGLALCQWLGVDPLLIGLNQLAPGARPYANVGQPNHLATLLLLGLIGGGSLFQRGRIRGALLSTIAGLLCVAMALTQSRQVWVGLLVVTAWTLVARRRAGVAVPAWGLPFFAATLAALTVLIGPLSEALSLGPARSYAELAGPGTRSIHWASMLDAISRSPWVGYGWNELSVAQSSVSPDHPASHEMIDHSHNLLLDLLVWNGLPLGLLLFGAIVWWLWNHIRACRDSSSAFMVASLLAIGTHALFEYPLSYAYFLIPTGVMVGGIDALAPVNEGVRMPRGLSGALMLLSLAVLLLVARDYIAIDADHRQMRMEKMVVSPYRSPESAPSMLILHQWREFLVVARSEPSEGMTAAQIERVRRVSMRFPQAPILMKFATIAGLNGRPDEARNALVKLCKMQVPARCDDARMSWKMLQQGHHELVGIDFPVASEQRPGASR